MREGGQGDMESGRQRDMKMGDRGTGDERYVEGR